jgi:hypothetical protein
VVRTGVSDAALRDYAIEPPAPRLGFRKPVRAQAIEVTVPADVELYRPEEMTLLASRSLIRRALSR